MSRRDVQKAFLIDEELEALTAKRLISDRLTLVRDIFLFSCYTGLAYADVYKLKRSEIRTGINGKKWLFIQRQKTETSSPVPLLPNAIEILEKPQTLTTDRTLAGLRSDNRDCCGGMRRAGRPNWIWSAAGTGRTWNASTKTRPFAKPTWRSSRKSRRRIRAGNAS